MRSGSDYDLKPWPEASAESNCQDARGLSNPMQGSVSRILCKHLTA